MKKFSVFFILSFIIFMSGLKAQRLFPADYFRPPLNIPMYLSGTFGELRSNHFHTGIDIKTQGVEGLKVYAAADGYISRIKIGLGGYGNALYIMHPNGYVTVYGHLKLFNKTITSYVRKKQYKQKSFVIDLYPEKGLLKVKKGEVIALSGNTGGSLGPHLHFEVRDAANQHPLNPLLFKSVKISDNKSPVIAQLAIYPISDSSLINNRHDTTFFMVKTGKNSYELENDTVINVFGKIAFGLRAYDRMNHTKNKNGVFMERLLLDSLPVFDIRMDELSFYTLRYINSFIDYSYFKKKKRRLITTELDTNNRLTIYKTIKNNGIFIFNDTLIHYFEYIVADAYDNKSSLRFQIKNVKPDTVISYRKIIDNSRSLFVLFSKKAELLTDSLKVLFPANAFYRSQYVSYGWKDVKRVEMFSPVFRVGNIYIPVQKYFKLSLKVAKPVVDSLQSKLYVGKLNDDGKWDFADGQFNDGWLNTKMRSLGKFAVLIDTIPPVIKPVNVKYGKNISGQKTLKVKIYDKQTGIKKYAGFLNDKWILLEYNPKKELLTYRFDWLLKKGKNRFKLYVFDNRDNETIYEAEVNY